jgi:hypothetical protein
MAARLDVKSVITKSLLSIRALKRELIDTFFYAPASWWGSSIRSSRRDVKKTDRG